MDYALLIASFSDANAHWSGQRLLHACLRGAIRDGRLAPGTRLLASRALARELGVARNSVLYAYEQLAAEGYTRSDRRGTIVASWQLGIPSLRPSAAPVRQLSRRAQSVSPPPVNAQLSGAFAPGVPSLADFPVTLWRRVLERAWRNGGAGHLNYRDPAGEAPLRAAIAEHLCAWRGAVCEAGDVFITDGTQSSLDLCARVFADAGETVWLENPGYRGALAAFQAAQLKVVGIKVDGDGIAPTQAQWRTHRPTLIYVTPSHQYPSGGVLAPERRLDLIARAQGCGALIIEDDYDSEFRHDGPPLAAMQGLTPDAPVLYLGTFSKTMFPALRIGFMVVPRALAPVLAQHLAHTVARGRPAEQLALAEFMRSGHFSLHLRRMRRLYRQRRDALAAALHTALGDVASIHGASAGMHLALRFHDHRQDDVAISARALSQSIVAPALSAHAVGPDGDRWCGLLLGYAQVPVELIGPMVAQLAALVRA